MYCTGKCKISRILFCHSQMGFKNVYACSSNSIYIIKNHVSLSPVETYVSSMKCKNQNFSLNSPKNASSTAPLFPQKKSTMAQTSVTMGGPRRRANRGVNRVRERERDSDAICVFVCFGRVGEPEQSTAGAGGGIVRELYRPRTTPRRLAVRTP